MARSSFKTSKRWAYFSVCASENSAGHFWYEVLIWPFVEMAGVSFWYTPIGIVPTVDQLNVHLKTTGLAFRVCHSDVGSIDLVHDNSILSDALASFVFRIPSVKSSYVRVHFLLPLFTVSLLFLFACLFVFLKSI